MIDTLTPDVVVRIRERTADVGVSVTAVKRVITQLADDADGVPYASEDAVEAQLLVSPESGAPGDEEIE